MTCYLVSDHKVVINLTWQSKIAWCCCIFYHKHTQHAIRGTSSTLLLQPVMLHTAHYSIADEIKKKKCSLSNGYTQRTVTSSVTIPQEWHGVHTVLPATHTFIHEWNEPSYIHLVFTRWRCPSKVAHIWISLLLIYRPRKDKRLSWPSWLTLQ